jgi:1-deoxyxylulose-5-phosphate synthase
VNQSWKNIYKMKRRQFIQTALISGSALVVSSPLQLLAKTSKHANDVITLGKTGIKTSRLAIGSGTSGVGGSSKQTRQLGIKGLADLKEAAYHKGIRFWDSADQYGSHPHLKEALKRVPRENVVILTKTHATSAAEMKKDLDRFRKEIGTDYLDIILLHFMTRGDWPEFKKGAMEVLSQAREDGIVRAHGVSCHSFEALKAAAESDWVQIDLARINPFGVSMDANVDQVEPVLRQMKKQGKSVMGMKVLGAGRLSDRIDECVKFILAREYVDSFTIGFEDISQMEEMIRKIG